MTVVIEYATPDDFSSVRALLLDADLTIEGLLEVPTSLFVALEDGEVVGAAALERHGADGLVRSVVVSQSHRGRGVGSRLVDAVEGEAEQLGLDALYLLTETAAPFFADRGYSMIERGAAPEPIMGSIEWCEACSDTAVGMEKWL